MKLAVGERNVATNLGINLGCVKEYYFSILYDRLSLSQTVVILISFYLFFTILLTIISSTAWYITA